MGLLFLPFWQLNFFVTFTFFMFVPFISLYLTGELGYSLLFAGVILAVRLVSQQGVMLIGGYFGDKYGHKKNDDDWFFYVEVSALLD